MCRGKHQPGSGCVYLLIRHLFKLAGDDNGAAVKPAQEYTRLPLQMEPFKG